MYHIQNIPLSLAFIHVQLRTIYVFESYRTTSVRLMSKSFISKLRKLGHIYILLDPSRC